LKKEKPLPYLVTADIKGGIWSGRTVGKMGVVDFEQMGLNFPFATESGYPKGLE